MADTTTPTWRLVPVGPTREIVTAMIREAAFQDIALSVDAAIHIYREAMRASPAPQELPPVTLPEHERRREFHTGICVALTVIKTTDSVAWAEIVRACGDGLIYHAAHIEPDEWELAGFDKHLWSELRKRKPRARTAIADDRKLRGGE